MSYTEFSCSEQKTIDSLKVKQKTFLLITQQNIHYL